MDNIGSGIIQPSTTIVDPSGKPLSTEKEYPTFEIVDDTLNQKLEPFVFSQQPDDSINPYELSQTLIRTMVKFGGLGLSANQCGLPHRVFIMRTIPFIIVFNPRIVDLSAEEIYLEEGCLSFPHLLVKIKRPKSIRVRFEDSYGQTTTEKFTGLTARIFQHETDHLNGIVFTSRANSYHLKDAYKKKKMLERKLKSNKYTTFKPLNTAMIKQVIDDINNQAAQVNEKT